MDDLPELEILAPDIVGFSIERLKYLISVIVSHKKDKHPGAYSQLNMQYLKNIVPKADKYLNYLREMGIIEWINYSAGRNSRMYRITKHYEDKPEFRTITDNYLIRRISQNDKRIKLRNSKKYPELNRFVYQVKIDVNAAMQTIERTCQDNINSDDEKTRMKAKARRTFSIAEILKIQSGQIYIKVSSTNGRLDTNYTRLPSELIKHLSINGKPLNELDIKNAQPFFAIGLFSPLPEIQKLIGQSFIMYAKSLQLTEKEDVILYTYLVVRGKFYDYMMKKFWLNEIPFADRQDLKEQIFTIFFGKNNSVNYSPAVKIFAEEFPNVFRLFSAIKKQKHNKLAILLQRIESRIMWKIR